jgi:hypothetical protein
MNLFTGDVQTLSCESGPLGVVHFSRHKWPGGISQLGFRTVESILHNHPSWSMEHNTRPRGAERHGREGWGLEGSCRSEFPS